MSQPRGRSTVSVGGWVAVGMLFLVSLLGGTIAFVAISTVGPNKHSARCRLQGPS
jgi:hypothetical protein